ncbi:MAG TPA: heparinase II/III family protein, partial [Verrucomicrobiae bacterium]|nr:heparinase II/III family protein [Verrucomicrobiae bacterium]
VVHTRRILYIGDEYWIISDSLAGERPHHFDLRFHLAPEAWQKVQVSGSTAHAPDLMLLFSEGSRLEVQSGWFAPLYGVKENASVLSAVVESKNSAEFVTVIMPWASGRQVPELKVLSPNTASQGLAIQITGVGPDENSTDYVAWSPSIADHVLPLFDCRASAVWCRADGRREHQAFAACNLQKCRSKHDDQIQFAAPSTPAAWVRWDPEHGLQSGTERFA